MFKHAALSLSIALGIASSGRAVDLESFFFNDADGTALTAAVNAANPGNQWSYASEATIPGDETTGDISTVQSNAYRLITDGNIDGGTQESRYLDIANVASGTVYLTATLSNWSFNAYDGSSIEQLRFGFLDNDTGNSGSTVTAQMMLRRDAGTGAMMLVADASGTAGSFDIANTVDLPDSQTGPFTMVLAVDKDSDSYEVFYKDGTDPTQVLGLGGVSRARDANSVRVVTDDFGLENFLPFVITEEVNIDSIVVSDTNPFTDLVTLQVDRATGAMSLVNNSGADVTGVTGLTLESTSGAVDLTDFLDFTGTLTDGQTAALDAAPGSAPGLWVKNPTEDVRAELTLSGGGVRTLDVDFIGNGGVKWLIGDLDFDGALDPDDYGILAANAEAPLTGTLATNYQLGDLNGDGFNDVLDFGLFKEEYIAANGAAAFANLIAGVPEPGSALLALAGAALLFGARRRRSDLSLISHRPKSHPMIHRYAPPAALLAALCLFSSPRDASAAVLHEFLFDDPVGTTIEAAANSIDPLVLFDADADSAGIETNGVGQLDLSGKNNIDFGSHYIDIDPGLATGKVYGILEATWDFQSTLDTFENEELRISLVTNDPRSTFITAQVEIERSDTDELIIFGEAFGDGVDIPAVTLNGGSLTQTDTFITVIEADLDNDTYEIFFSPDAGASFQSIGSAALDPTRGVESVRLVFNNDFVDDNVLIDSFTFGTDELPFDIEPDLLTLEVNTTTGGVSITNSTSTDFDIDYYRILSGDDSLLVGDWNSLQDQAFDAVDGPDVGATAGDGTGEVWTEAGGSDAGVLSESFLLSSSVITSSSPALSLGSVFDLAGDTGQLTFEYRDAATGTIFTGDIELVAGLAGDFNEDGVVDAADYATWRNGLGTTYDAADYDIWRANYGATSSGAGQGSSAPIPEPSAVVLILLAVTPWATRLRKRA